MLYPLVFGLYSSPFTFSASEPASSQKVPDISIGKVRLGGRHTESRTTRVSGPVLDIRLTRCQGVHPTVASVDWFKHLGQAVSSTLRRGPLSEVISRVRT